MRLPRVKLSLWMGKERAELILKHFLFGLSFLWLFGKTFNFFKLPFIPFIHRGGIPFISFTPHSGNLPSSHLPSISPLSHLFTFIPLPYSWPIHGLGFIPQSWFIPGFPDDDDWVEWKKKGRRIGTLEKKRWKSFRRTNRHFWHIFALGAFVCI